MGLLLRSSVLGQQQLLRHFKVHLNLQRGGASYLPAEPAGEARQKVKQGG
jgi:hypothetical protein